ncbi:MAG: Holliday junction branch migration protein RuvA, partial [Dehalococcoidia bacterium]
MIAGLHGKLEARGLGHALVRVGGVTLQVFMPTSALARLGGVGEEVHLHTHLHVREDILALYGFVTPQELALFQSLMGVTGVGPRLALAVLSTYSAQELTLAIMGGSVDVLSQVPGLGKKIAARLILELKGKLG